MKIELDMIEQMYSMDEEEKTPVLVDVWYALS